MTRTLALTVLMFQGCVSSDWGVTGGQWKKYGLEVYCGEDANGTAILVSPRDDPELAEECLKRNESDEDSGSYVNPTAWTTVETPITLVARAERNDDNIIVTARMRGGNPGDWAEVYAGSESGLCCMVQNTNLHGSTSIGIANGSVAGAGETPGRDRFAEVIFEITAPHAEAVMLQALVAEPQDAIDGRITNTYASELLAVEIIDAGLPIGFEVDMLDTGGF
jgi:hypothetical protein